MAAVLDILAVHCRKDSTPAPTIMIMSMDTIRKP